MSRDEQKLIIISKIILTFDQILIKNLKLAIGKKFLQRFFTILKINYSIKNCVVFFELFFIYI